jgi:hypothetical protein
MSELANQTSVFKDKTRMDITVIQKAKWQKVQQNLMITKVIDDIFASEVSTQHHHYRPSQMYVGTISNKERSFDIAGYSHYDYGGSKKNPSIPSAAGSILNVDKCCRRTFTGERYGCGFYG